MFMEISGTIIIRVRSNLGDGATIAAVDKWLHGDKLPQEITLEEIETDVNATDLNCRVVSRGND